MSSEAHRRFLKTHEVLTLKQKGLDFVVNSQAKWDIEASIFDQVCCLLVHTHTHAHSTHCVLICASYLWIRYMREQYLILVV
jgi:hypothetical protein